jgi:hypothetical protein
MSITEIIMERDVLKQQLANREKQVVMLREALEVLGDIKGNFGALFVGLPASTPLYKAKEKS